MPHTVVSVRQAVLSAINPRRSALARTRRDFEINRSLSSVFPRIQCEAVKGTLTQRTPNFFELPIYSLVSWGLDLLLWLDLMPFVEEEAGRRDKVEMSGEHRKVVHRPTFLTDTNDLDHQESLWLP